MNNLKFENFKHKKTLAINIIMLLIIININVNETFKSTPEKLSKPLSNTWPRK